MFYILGAKNKYPFECYKSFPAKSRKQYGLQLCPRANSTVVSNCWKALSPKISANEAANVCKKVESQKQLDCIKSSAKAGQSISQDVLSKC